MSNKEIAYLKGRKGEKFLKEFDEKMAVDNQNIFDALAILNVRTKELSDRINALEDKPKIIMPKSSSIIIP